MARVLRGAMYCVSQLQAFPSYGDCVNLHCPDKGGLTVLLYSLTSRYIVEFVPFSSVNILETVIAMRNQLTVWGE